MKLVLLILLPLLLLFAQPVYATLGVGVGVGKIEVEEDLKPGLIYNLPSITVVNTGDEQANYILSIEHHENQPERIPEDDWFKFSPSEFTLEPGEVKEVQIKLDLPINAPPDDYFAYIEARPTKKTAVGNTAVNIAAATKLNFTIVPGSWIAGLYYKLISIWEVYEPWPQVGAIIMFVLFTVLSIRRLFNIEVKLMKKGFPKWALALIAVLFFLVYLIFWMKFFEVV